MAQRKPEWEKIYEDYVKSGLTTGDYIRKHQLSTYAFEKFKKLDAMNNTKDTKATTDPLFVPVQLKSKNLDPVINVAETSLELFCENIKIIVTEQTSHTILVNVLKAMRELC